MHQGNHEKRQGTRQDVYLEDGILAKLKVGGKEYSAQVYDLNPQGVGILLPQSSEASNLKAGDTAMLRVDSGSRESIGALVTIVNQQGVRLRDQDYQKLGCSFQESRSFRADQEAYSPDGYFPLPPDFQPFATTTSPFTFRNELSFRVAAIDAQGMILSTSKRNRELVPGLGLDFLIQLVHLNTHRVGATVEAIHIPLESRHFYLKARFHKPSYALLRDVSEYILCYSDQATPKALREAGLPVDGIDSAIRVSYAKTDAEMLEVFRLRHLVAVAEGRIGADTPPEEMRDAFDDYSRQLLFWVGPRPIACARLIFVSRQKERSEISQFIEIPPKYWRENFVEVSRFAIHPDFRGGDVYINMIRHSTRIALEAGMAYAFADCRPFLLKVYKRIGAIDTGLCISHPFYPGEPMHVIYFDGKKLSFRARGKFTYWSKVILPIFDFGSRRGRMHLNPLMRAQIVLGKALNWGVERWRGLAWNFKQGRKKKGGSHAAS